MRKPDFCICENKDADQLRGNRIMLNALVFKLCFLKRVRWDPIGVGGGGGFCVLNSG